MNNLMQTAYGSASKAPQRDRNRERGGLAGEKIPSGFRVGQIQQYGPEQMDLFKQLFSHVGPDSFLSKLGMGDEETFNEIEAPAHRQFNEKIGGLASRFSGMGSGGFGSRKSSGFQNQATSAASNFAQDLASQRQGLQQQALKDLMGMSESLLGQRPNNRFLIDKYAGQQGQQGGGLAGAASGAGSGAALGSFAGPWGTAAGALAGGALGYFGGK